MEDHHLYSKETKICLNFIQPTELLCLKHVTHLLGSDSALSRDIWQENPSLKSPPYVHFYFLFSLSFLFYYSHSPGL
jgi:hypothetical protein